MAYQQLWATATARGPQMKWLLHSDVSSQLWRPFNPTRSLPWLDFLWR